MIVLDASLVVELLTNSEFADSLRIQLAELDGGFLAPHLLDVEVTSALRSMVGGRRLDGRIALRALEKLAALPVLRCAHLPLLDRIWELRHNFTAYDAAYIALAESMDAILCTSDQKLCNGHRAQVMLFER